MAASQAEQKRLQAEAAAALQDAREALGRESDIQEQLQRADQVTPPLICFTFIWSLRLSCLHGVSSRVALPCIPCLRVA